MNEQSPNVNQNNDSGVQTNNVSDSVNLNVQPTNTTSEVQQPDIGNSVNLNAANTTSPQQSTLTSQNNTSSTEGVEQNAVTEVLTQSSTNTDATPNKDDNKKNINYKPPGKFKTFVLIVFFGALVAFIIFLPEIQEYVAGIMGGKTAAPEITSGKLKCTLNTNTTNLDKSIERVFTFTDKKLVSARFSTVTKGDVTQDEATLNDLAEKCKLKKEYVSDIPGVSVTCEYSAGLLTEREHFDYKDYDIEKVKTAYTEAGGEVIEYEYGYDIDKIMTTMRQSGYTCNKEK